MPQLFTKKREALTAPPPTPPHPTPPHPAAYMVSSGAPYDCEDHFCAVADLAILLHRAIDLIPNPIDLSKSLRIKVGLNSGCVLGTVMGTRMPQYVLVGDDVNVASRMESTGEAGKTQVTEHTAQLLRRTGKYILQERGEIQVKGKGTMRTFWLVGASPAHERINEAYISALLNKLRPKPSLRRHQSIGNLLQGVSSSNSLSSVDSGNNSSGSEKPKRRVRVLVLTKVDETDEQLVATFAALRSKGYECEAGTSTKRPDEDAQSQFDVLLVDLDTVADNVDGLDAASSFRGLVLLMKSLSVGGGGGGGGGDDYDAIHKGGREEETDAPLLLYKPVDPDTFHKVVRNRISGTVDF